MTQSVSVNNSVLCEVQHAWQQPTTPISFLTLAADQDYAHWLFGLIQDCRKESRAQLQLLADSEAALGQLRAVVIACLTLEQSKKLPTTMIGRIAEYISGAQAVSVRICMPDPRTRHIYEHLTIVCPKSNAVI